MTPENRERLDAGQVGLRHVELDGGVWLHVGSTDEDTLTSLEAMMSMPAAVLDTFRMPPVRPQRIEVGSWTVWSLRTVRFDAGAAAVTSSDLVIAVGPTGAVTTGKLPAAATRWLGGQGSERAAASTSAAPRIAVGIFGDLLDDVARVVAELDDEVEDIEAAVFTPERASHAERIYRLKREVQTVRRSVGPLPELLSSEARPAGRSGMAEALRVPVELSARARRLVEQLSHLDDLLDSVLTAHLTQVAIRQNDDMRRISAWVAIVAVPTAIASIYGMNFRFMPELGWRFGYPLVLLAMLSIGTVLYRLLRRSGWL